MTSQTGHQIITMHISPNISSGERSMRMTFGQLIEHEMRNGFFVKSYTKRGEEAKSHELSKT